jgi:hypothetical protein
VSALSHHQTQSSSTICMFAGAAAALASPQLYEDHL